MATGKRYYWLKLKESFMNSDTVDYFMSQKDGANYVVLYQMLCLKTINTGGRLQRQIGEVIIPYDIEKIQRDCKYFSADTIRIALKLYQAFGLIYEDAGGVLVLSDHKNLVGSETDYAEKNRRLRAQQRVPFLPDGGHNVSDNVSENVSTDIRDRDKRLDTRDKSTEDRDTKTVSGETTRRTSDVQRVIEAWNALGLQNIRRIAPGTDRDQWLRKRIRDYGIDAVLEAVEKVRGSRFLMGENKRGWQITFDWFIRPNNFPKVLDGNYDDREEPVGAESGGSPLDDLRALHAMYEGKGE